MPIHFLPPWWRPFCSASRLRSVSRSLSRPPSASICFFSSSVRCFSVELLEPFGRDLGGQRIRDVVEALEHVAEHAIEVVEIALVLHQRRARQIVEILDAPAGEVLVHRLHQRQIFPQRDRHAGLLQLGKESRKHFCLAGVPRPKPAVNLTRQTWARNRDVASRRYSLPMRLSIARLNAGTRSITRRAVRDSTDRTRLSTIA